MTNPKLAAAASPEALQFRGKLMVGFLVAQYVIGMILDFFIGLPTVHPGTADGPYLARVWEGFTWALTGGGGAALASHVGIATLLILGAGASLYFSIMARHKTWIIASSVGAFGVLIAWLNGIEFINTAQDKHSFAMAIAFMIALVSYCAGLYYAKKSSN